MLALFIIAVIVLFLFFVIKAMTSNGGTLKKTKSIPKEEQIMIENKGWLEKRWDLAKKEQHAGEFKIVSHWFFDEVTDRQIQKLKEIGLRITSGTPTKGEASDLIGLFEPVEEENAEILRFFKIPLTGMNQSKARHEVAMILSDPDKLEAWKKRPATTSQKEFYNFFNLKVPKGLSYEAALKFISEHDLTEEEREEWDAYEEIYDTIIDPDFRYDNSIKKISLALYRSAIDQLKMEGKILVELRDDIQVVVDKIIEIKPEIQTE